MSPAAAAREAMKIVAPDEGKAMDIIVPGAGEARLLRGCPGEKATAFQEEVDKVGFLEYRKPGGEGRGSACVERSAFRKEVDRVGFLKCRQGGEGPACRVHIHLQIPPHTSSPPFPPPPFIPSLQIDDDLRIEYPCTPAHTSLTTTPHFPVFADRRRPVHCVP